MIDFFIDPADTQKILLSSHAAMEVEKIYWFVNDKLYASCRPDERGLDHCVLVVHFS